MPDLGTTTTTPAYMPTPKVERHEHKDDEVIEMGETKKDKGKNGDSRV
jgi:hypothetical protein